MSTENNDAVSTLSSNSREASPPTSVIAKYIVILIAASLILLFFGVRPALEGYFGNNSKISNQLTANESNKGAFKELMAKQANLANTKTQVNEFLESFPSSANQQAMLTELNSIASKNGVTIGSIAPTLGTAAPAGGAAGTGAAAGKASSELVAPINIDMSLTGGNPNQFLADLEKSQRVFIINSLSYTGGEKGNSTMSIKATTYVVQPLVNPDVEVPATGTDTGAPAPTDEAAGVPADPAPVAPVPADQVPVAPSAGP